MSVPTRYCPLPNWVLGPDAAVGGGVEEMMPVVPRVVVGATVVVVFAAVVMVAAVVVVAAVVGGGATVVETGRPEVVVEPVALSVVLSSDPAAPTPMPRRSATPAVVRSCHVRHVRPPSAIPRLSLALQHLSRRRPSRPILPPCPD